MKTKFDELKDPTSLPEWFMNANFEMQAQADCFNFGTVNQPQFRYSEELNPVDFISDMQRGDMDCLPPIHLFELEEEENNNTPPYLKPLQPDIASCGNDGKSYTSSITNVKSPLKPTSANILLSQGILPENPLHKSGGKVKSEAMDFQPFPFGLTEDEENYLSTDPMEFRVPTRSDHAVKRERPVLKLDIVTPTPVSSAVFMPSTPEVQTTLCEPKKGFDLINYVVSNDYANEGTVEVVKSTPKACKRSEERDHDYVDPALRPTNVISDFVVKTEPLSPDFTAAATTASEDKGYTTERRRKRRSDSTFQADYYVFDTDVVESDDSADWIPSTPREKKPKSKRPKTSRNPPPRSFKSDSDAESVASSQATDKYRELRDKNNEASRKSRLNRKKRDLEMKKTADQLESDNRALKSRAERMQKLVLEMRELIMKTIKESKRG